MAEPTGAEAMKATRWPKWQLQPPPEGDPQVGEWVWQKYELMRKYRDSLGLPQLWLHNHELYRGRIFKKAGKGSRVAVNLFFKVINNLKANLTDNKPRAGVRSRGNAPVELAQVWQAAYDLWWDATQQQRSLQESVGKSELYGYQCDKVVFNPELEGGLGDVETVRCDTFSTLFWPKSRDIQKDPMVCHVEAMELGEIYSRWPDVRGRVKPDPEYSEVLGEGRNKVRANKSREIRPMGTPSGYKVPEEDDTGGGSCDIERALVVELWVKDFSIVWVDPMTGESYEVEDGASAEAIGLVQQSKYPGFIRCLHVTNGGKLVLDDVPNPSVNPNLPREIASQCYLWDKFPFLRRWSYSDDESEYGLSIMEQIETLVIEISKKISQISHHLDASCKPPLLLPQNCGVRRDDVNNLPSRIWEPTAAMSQFIRFLQVPGLSSDYNVFVQSLLRLVEIVTGLTDVSEGRRPSGITAASAISELQEKAQTIFREKIRNIDLYIEEQGRMFISLGQNWYTEGRVLAYQDGSGVEQIPFRGVEVQGEYMFEVEAGSTLPKNRWAHRQHAIELFKAGVLDPQALLEEFDWPKRDEILQRVQKGPMGAALEKLANTGMFSPETLQAIEQVMKMKEADYKRAFPQATLQAQFAQTAMQQTMANRSVGGAPQ